MYELYYMFATRNLRNTTLVGISIIVQYFWKEYMNSQKVNKTYRHGIN